MDIGWVRGFKGCGDRVLDDFDGLDGGFRCFVCGRRLLRSRVRLLGGGLYICCWCDGLGDDVGGGVV
jgi:hypothetical protein